MNKETKDKNAELVIKSSSHIYMFKIKDGVLTEEITPR
jgi:hypothetical protein